MLEPYSGPPQGKADRPPPDAEAQIARWERDRAHGRTEFIVRRGIIGWGLPAAVLTLVYKVIDEQGLILSPRLTPDLRMAIVVVVVLFPLVGWMLGRWLWTVGEARYQALIGGREKR